jgi:hypothetical protein
MKTRTTILATALVVLAGFSAGCSKTTPDSQAASVRKDRFDTVVIPDGTSVVATLDALITTETGHDGDGFTLTTVDPITVGTRIVVPAGTRINGELRNVEASGRTSGRARMTLAYLGMTDGEGKNQTISARSLSLQAASATHTDVERIAAGTVLGAVVGGIAGGTKGAAIGAGAGAGAGVVVMLATQGDELVLEAGQKLVVEMTSATSMQVLASN